MKVICIESIGLSGPADAAGVSPTIYSEPGSEIEVPDEEVYRLLKLGSVRLPDDDKDPKVKPVPSTNVAPTRRFVTRASD
jgi:hypothetical protein